LRARRTWAFLGILALVIALAPAGLPAAATEAPTIHSPTPHPGEVVAAGDTTVSARVVAATDLQSVSLTVDGESVPVEQTTSDADGTLLTARAPLADGDHVIALTVTDGAGQTTTRSWEVTATARYAQRIAGITRVDTAAKVSTATYPAPASARAAVVARADDFADALAGVPLAVQVDGPLLLSHGDVLSPEAAAELHRVLPGGATVHLLGGRAALGDDVATAVGDLGFEVVRHAGADRYATAAAIARSLAPSDAAILVSGHAFPDALTASAPAARDGRPVLLTGPDRLPDATAAALTAREVVEVAVVGGTAAVGTEVEDALRARDITTTRVAGPDRYATAAAVAATFYDDADGIAIASGVTFADALAGTRHAASHDHPLLLTDRVVLPAATRAALRAQRPAHIDVYGGGQAVSDHVAGAALRAAVDGPTGFDVVAVDPADGTSVGFVDEVRITLDRAVDPATTTVHLTVADREIALVPTSNATAATLAYRLRDGEPVVPHDVVHDARLTVLAIAGEARARDDVRFGYLRPDPVFATVGGVDLHLPSRDVELIGFHESNHDGARQQNLRDTATPKLTLPSRSRGTGSRSAADVVAAPDQPIMAPVTGRVVRGGSYVLYCRYTDNFAVIEPDAHPGWEVKVLHFQGIQVRVGDRVEASTTMLGTGPRQLPFESQVDEYSQPRNWPHVHVEVVDPSIPDRPGGGC
jgi:putative cell wall-binding protein